MAGNVLRRLFYILKIIKDKSKYRCRWKHLKIRNKIDVVQKINIILNIITSIFTLSAYNFLKYNLS